MLVVLTTTGMVISYAWASNLVYTVTGSPRPAAAAGSAGQPRQPPGDPARAPGSGRTGVSGADRGTSGPPGPGRPSAPAAPLDDLVVAAARQVPGWSTVALRLPARPGAPATATITDGAHWNRFARSTLTLDSRTGVAVKWEPYAAASAGQKLRGWMRFAHTGELGGLAGEAVAGAASLGGGFLVWTGMALSLRRFAAWRARLSSRSTAASSSAISELQ